MKTKSRSMLSLILTAAMLISMLTTAAFAVSVGADADPLGGIKALDKIVIDFRNQTSFALTGGQYYAHTPSTAEPDPDLGGKYSWDADEKAMKLEYHEVARQKPYRFMFRVNQNKNVTAEYAFAAIVYKVENADNYVIRLSNTPNQGQAFVYDSKTGNPPPKNGEWTVASANISTADSNGKSILGRWADGNINTISFDIASDKANVYIKEVALFKSIEDLNAYYTAIDIEKDPVTYMSDAQKKVLGTGGTAASTPSGTSSAATPTVPLDKQTPPVVWKFNGLVGQTETGWKFTDHTDNTEGEYNFVTVNGEQVLKLKYSPYGSFPNFRFMPASKTKGQISEDLRYMRITYMTTDPVASQIVIINNKNHSDKATLVENTAASRGEWITSNAVDIGMGELVTRFNTGMHCTIGVTSNNDLSEIYIKEIGFFASPEQAYAYYGDEATAENTGYTTMYFASTDATGVIFSGPNYGVNAENKDTDAVDITYAESTNHGVNYMAKLKFNEQGTVSAAQKYIRVLYAADHPDGVNQAIFRIRNDKSGSNAIIDSALADTNGEFVLSNTTVLDDDTIHRFAGSGAYSSAMHNSFHITTTVPGGTYSIKAVYFFTTKEAADSFEVPSNVARTLLINGNDISKYQIVISSDRNFSVVNAADTMVDYVKSLTGTEIPVVTDDTPESEYEILVGQSKRALSTSLLASYNDGEDSYKRYAAAVKGSKLIVTSMQPYTTDEAMDLMLSSFLYKGMTVVPEEIIIDDTCKFDGLSPTLGTYDNWANVTNSLNPQVFTEDFSSDEGYFTEENYAQDFNIASGVMTAKTDDKALTYIHVYEKNASIGAKLSYKDAGNNGDFGLMLRYTSADAYVKAGYDFESGEWYITEREGTDFYTKTPAKLKATLTPGTVYNVELTVNYDTATLSVDGKEILKVTGLTQVSPGRIGIYAEDITLTVDDVKAVLLSGQGTIMQNVVHTLLPDEEYREGGSVFEMADGSINYTHHYGVDFKSLDGGKTWTRINAWTSYNGYVNMLRLVDGTFMKVASEGGWMYSYTSNDEGKTWVRGGQITQTPFRGDKTLAASAVNMNDKINQSASGRIFYSQNYETTVSDFEGRKVFCEFFYSDDNGVSWTKSDTTSWTIEGNETENWFGECKILECADGTVRMYNSWNDYGCVVYSDSTDGGKTFGPIKTMAYLPCTRSSMQFFRDPHGETDTTYYMLWVNSHDNPQEAVMPRAALSLAKSTDGKTWSYLGDIWRWQSNYRYGTGGAFLNHVVDPFVKTSKDSVIIGTGLSEHTAMVGDNSYHGAQRQHIWSIAKSTLGEGTPLGNVEYLGSFTDVHTGNSYYEAVKFVTDAGLFNGTSATTFSPSDNMTRSMFVTVLGRLDGADVSKYTTPTFKDVAAGQWYTSYVEWAAANSIVNGIGNGLYGINGNVTVEQVCVMLARYNGNKAAANPSGKTVSDFTDASSVSAWAADGVKWAVENGVYTGAGTALNPTANASRALVATMFHNYVTAFGE